MDAGCHCLLVSDSVGAAIGSVVVIAVGTVLLAISGVLPRAFESRLARAGRSTKELWRDKKKPHPWNYHDIDGDLLLGRLPRTIHDVDELLEAGVGAIVTLNESWELKVPSEILEEKGVQWLHLPTPDYFSPTIADIQIAVLFIEFHVNSGVKVYVHCNAGVGRSAVITVAYLVHKNRWTLRQAYSFLRTKRTVVSIPTSMWTLRPHWRRLGKWYRRLQRERGHSTDLDDVTLEESLIGPVEAMEIEDVMPTEEALKEELSNMVEVGGTFEEEKIIEVNP